MVSDSITSASIPCAPSVKDLGKKKRVNRLAKLKQCKLDARREQWLSQVKKKNGSGREDWSGDDHGLGGNTGSAENEEMRDSKARNDENFHGSSLDSPSNSTVSFNSLLGSNDSGTNYSGSSSSSSSAGCCSGNVTEEDEEGDDGCLDDWEAIADALAADDKTLSPQHDIDSEPVGRKDSTLDNPRMVPQMAPPKVNPRAWRPDDAFRPQSLPNLSKNHSFPNSGRHYANGGIPWGTRNSNLTVPTSCPICCEDLDLTDSSFMPCLCGFRLCLFCHKRILEQDCRCPGCRKPYEQDHGVVVATVQDGSLAFRLTRSHSMMARP